MSLIVARVQGHKRMMISAHVERKGIQLAFADGKKYLVPFTAIPEIGSRNDIASIKLPNPYELVIRSKRGTTVEIPWDFPRYRLDSSYRARAEAAGALGRQMLGTRVRNTRTAAGMTQEKLAAATGIGRVTLSRIEMGKQSPRYDTLQVIATGLQCPIVQLLTGDHRAQS